MKRTRWVLLGLGILIAAFPAGAGNGLYLQGVGASNSALGGVSTALATDVVGALTFNPALLTQFEGDQIYFGAEIGFNYSETPIQEEVAFTSIGTPPTFQDHYAVGVGIALNKNITLDLGAYFAAERSVTGRS